MATPHLPMAASSFPYCDHGILNDQFMWLYRQVLLLEGARPGSDAFRERLGTLGAYVRNQFVLEEDLLRNLGCDRVQEQIVDHVQILCYLRFLLAAPADLPKLATLHDEFQVMLRRHLFEKDRLAVAAINDAIAIIDERLLPEHRGQTGALPGAVLQKIIALPWGQDPE